MPDEHDRHEFPVRWDRDEWWDVWIHWDQARRREARRRTSPQDARPHKEPSAREVTYSGRGGRGAGSGDTYGRDRSATHPREYHHERHDLGFRRETGRPDGESSPWPTASWEEALDRRGLSDFDAASLDDDEPSALSRIMSDVGLRIERYIGRGPRGYRRSDERIYEDVCERLLQHPEIDALDIKVTVQQGEVTLAGTVDSRRVKRLAEWQCDLVRGVCDVHNQLRIVPSPCPS